MTESQQKIDVTALITSYVTTHPGTNLGKTGVALNAFYSTSHIHTVIRKMIARGQIRAERDELNHYCLYIDQAPDQGSA